MASDTDRIEKRIFLRAPRERVWRALTDSVEFGAWFGMRLDAPFTPGATVHGTIQPTKVDAVVAAQQKTHEGVVFELVVERVDPQRHFSFRWHPSAVDRGVDYSAEPMTLVAFDLRDVPGGVEVTVTESGFDSIPPDRRARAFASNDAGWGIVVGLLDKYLAHAA